MKDDIVVSIITPCYNAEKTISKTIETVQQQTFSKWELNIIDNGSTDNSVTIIREFISKDNRINLFFSENGAALARQKGIEEAKGKYIAFLDADDLWHKDKLMKQVTFMDQKNYDFSYHPYEYIDEQNNLLNKLRIMPESVSYKSQLKGSRIGCLTVMYRREKIRNTKIPNLRKRNDAALWLRILKEVGEGFNLNENLGYYRVSDNSLSSGSKFDLLEHHYTMFRQSEGFSVIKSLYYVIWNVITYIDIKLNWEKSVDKI